MKQKLLPLENSGERIQDFFVDPKSDYIYFLKSINGKKIKFSTKTTQINKAKRVANQRLQEILGIKKRPLSVLIKDEIPKWIEAKESEGLDQKTLAKIYQARKRIEPFWGGMFPAEITRETASEWIKWMGQEFPGQQKFNAVKYIRNFCKYLAEKGLLPTVPRIVDPDAKKDRAKRAKNKERIFTKSEFKIVYRAGIGIEKLLALFMYTMATRIEETISLKLDEEILLNEKIPVYRWSFGQNKSDLSGQHALGVELLKALRAHCKELKSGEMLFPQQFKKTQPLKPQQIDWDGWRKRASLGWHWTSHTFRHTCLSMLFNDAKYAPLLICKLYRTSIKTAMDTYIKPTKQGMAQMRNAIEVNI